MKLKGTISVVSLDPIDFQSKDKNSDFFLKCILNVIFSTNVILLKQVFFLFKIIGVVHFTRKYNFIVSTLKCHV